MIRNKHLVPQLIVDIAESMLKEKNSTARGNYEDRILAIKAFCEESLKAKTIGKRK
jgi:hypothetical protein